LYKINVRSHHVGSVRGSKRKKSGRVVNGKTLARKRKRNAFAAEAGEGEGGV